MAGCVIFLLLVTALSASAQELPRGWKQLRRLDDRRLLAADLSGAQVVCHAGWAYLGTNPSGHHLFKAAVDAAVMIWVPAGAFVRGSLGPVYKRDSKGLVKTVRAGEGYLDEWPQRQVSLRGYYMQKQEVSWAQWSRFVAANSTQRMPARPDWSGDEHPVVNVSWDDAVAYCKWVGRRLPSEAEWERAARGPAARRYPWGNQAPSGRRANGRFETAILPDPPGSGSLQERALRRFARMRRPVDGFTHSAPVGAYPRGASPCGCLNMAGNVWEWCADAYAVDYYRRESSLKNPTGPRVPDPGPGTTGRPDRVDRGGAFDVGAWHMRVTHRGRRAPGARASSLGFRTAR